jgi:hypothetical protein
MIFMVLSYLLYLLFIKSKQVFPTHGKIEISRRRGSPKTENRKNCLQGLLTLDKVADKCPQGLLTLDKAADKRPQGLLTLGKAADKCPQGLLTLGKAADKRPQCLLTLDKAAANFSGTRKGLNCDFRLNSSNIPIFDFVISRVLWFFK